MRSSAPLTLPRAKRGSVAYPGLQGSGQRLSIKNYYARFIRFRALSPVISPSLTYLWAHFRVRFPFCLLHVCNRSPEIVSCLCIISTSKYQPCWLQEYALKMPRLSSFRIVFMTLSKQDKWKRFRGSAVGKQPLRVTDLSPLSAQKDRCSSVPAEILSCYAEAFG